MLTGRRVDRKHHGHGVTYNSDRGTTVHQAAGHYVASVFDVVHDQGARRNLYSLNHSFRDPGTRRTSYRGQQPIRNGDVANLATDALDLPVVPGSTLDRPRKLDAFRR